MQPDPARCAECGGETEVGFIPDSTYGGVLQQKWARGLPVKSWFLGVKVDLENCRRVEVYRCKACGYLKCYAK